MYQSNIYLEVRVLLSAVPGVFSVQTKEDSRKDILSVKATFTERNNDRIPVESVTIMPAALRKVVLLSQVLGAKINESSRLERLAGSLQEPPDDRNFTGYSVVVAEGGSLNIMFHQKQKKIRIEEIRIEEDAGHLSRTGSSRAHMDWTYAGCPSMRIRTSADFELGEEAELFLNELYSLMMYLKLTYQEQGESSIRCNAYVALSQYPEKAGYCVKLRNLNSFNFARKAINSEITRQEALLTSGASVQSESRLWIEEQNLTQEWKVRDNQAAKFKKVEPAIDVQIENVPENDRVTVELPEQRRIRLRSQYGLSKLRSLFICAEKDRADYFEQCVAYEAEPLLTAHWMASELARVLNMTNGSYRQCKLTPEKFAQVMNMLRDQRIHSGIAKKLIQTICKTGETPEAVLKREKIQLLSTREEIEPFVESVLAQNPKSVDALIHGDMAPLEHITGLVMKESQGLAVPQKVKEIIKEKLQISVVYVFTMGGAISARKFPDGTIGAGDANILLSLVDKENALVPVQISSVSQMLSEETEPADWAKLICGIKQKIEGGTVNGIIVTHGTDTLSYTAALLYWLFNSASVPIVITASSTIPAESDEAKRNLNLAIKTAEQMRNGVYVVYGEKIYSPLNLKFLNNGTHGFANWNMQTPVHDGNGFLSQQFMSVQSPEPEVMTKILNEAASRLDVVRMYPGMSGYRLEKRYQGEDGVDFIVLELYASGTGNMRNSDYSLKPFLLNSRKKGLHVYCTSQQECKVDFSDYSTSARVWREGAVPMGHLTVESVVALFFASYLVADDEDELSELMESID